MTIQRLAIERPSPFRRRRFLASRRRRSLTLLLLRAFLPALLLVSLPVVGAVWVITSPQFRLREVHIEGTDRATIDQVATALAALEGRHLLDLSLRDVEESLSGNPWIERAAIRKQLPDRLVVEVHERQPVALLRLDEALFYVDRQGRVIEPYDPAGPVDLVLLSAAAGPPIDVEQALEIVAALDRSAPEWAAELSDIEILGFGDFRVRTAALPFPVLLTSGRVEQQVEQLRSLLPEILSRYQEVAAVDLRFLGQIVIQPAVQPRSQEG